MRPSAPKVGRNDPCPCGSGKKWKHCCATKTTAQDDEPPRWATRFVALPIFRAPHAFAALVIAMLLLIANRSLINHTAAPIWDADQAYSTWHMLVADFARNGRLLAWNPWSNGGSPDGCDPQFGALSPFNVLVGLVTGGTYAGFITYWLALWIVAALGIVVLARHLGAPAWGGFAAAMGYVMSGAFTGHAEHTSLIHGLAWLPWIIWRLDVGLLRGSRWAFVESGALFGLCGLACYPMFVLVHGGLVLAWAITRAVSQRDAEARARLPWREALLAVAIVAVVSGLIVSPLYAGYLVESQGFSDRSGVLDRDTAVLSNALHPGALTTVASPYFPILWMVNNQPDLDHPEIWAYTDVSSLSVYVGPVVLWLAVVALTSRLGGRFRVALLALALLGIGLALGQALPLRGWLYDLFPPSRYFRHASSFRNYAVFLCCVLGALGARDVAVSITGSDRRQSRILWTSAVGVASAALLTIIGVMVWVPKGGPFIGYAVFEWILGFGGIVLAGVLLSFVRRLDHRLLALSCLVSVAAIDGLLAHAISTPFMFEPKPSVLSDWQTLDRKHKDDLTGIPMTRRPFPAIGPGLTNKHLPVKEPVMSSYTPFANALQETFRQDANLVGLALGPERTWFAEHAIEIAPTSAAFDAIRTRARERKTVPLVVHAREAMLTLRTELEPVPDEKLRAIATHEPAQRIPIRVAAYEPDLLAFAVTCPKDGWLLVTDRFASGWRVTVNGLVQEIHGGFFFFRALRVKQGENEIRFTYHPFGRPLLLLLSWTLLFVVPVGTMAHRLRRMPTQT